MRSFDEIVVIVQDMQRDQGPTLQAMKDVLDRYDGDWVLPIPSMADEPSLPPLTPALIGEAVDSMAQRASSVRPTISSPAIKPLVDTGRGSRQYATIRRKIIAATYHDSRWLLGRRRFYRQLAAYHTTSVVVLPDFDTQMPIIQIRDPLSTFVEPQANEQLRDPTYCAFITRFSGISLRAKFPAVRSENGGPITPHEFDQLWDVVEWIDLDQSLFGLVGPVKAYGVHINQRSQNAPWMPLAPPVPNRLGLLPAVVPHNVSLGKIASRIGSMLGSVDLQAKLMALDIIAQEKAIFPDMYAIGRQGGMPTIVGGAWKDGREGDINMLNDVEAVGMLRNTPDQRTSQVIDRLERNFRVSTGLIPQTGGETYGALRTGRGIDALAGMAIDPRVQELHEITEAYLPQMNRAILQTYKTYWGSKSYSLYSGWPDDLGHVEFTPDRHIETLDNTVSYAIAGADVIQQTQILGSLRGSGTMSRRTFMAKHPYINDPESEGSLIDEESFEEALRNSILQQLSQGQMPLMVAVEIRKQLQKGEDIFTAVAKADEAARKLQATQAPAPPEGMVAPPEAMPGLAAGPAAMQQPMPEPPPQVEVPGDVSRMRQLMSAMGA